MADEVNTFSALDYVIFGLLLAGSAAIGIFYGCFGKRPSTSKELLVANRQMTMFPTAMSLLASFMSGITILGNPAESYQYGTQYWWAGVAYTFVVIVVANVFVPMYSSLNITSGYEYLEKRFNKPVKILVSCVFMVQTTIYMALVLYAPALAMNQVTKINIWILVFSIGGVCTFYTAIGGMKAVMWTDVFQIVIMLVGLLLSFIIGLQEEGGIRNVVEKNWNADRIEFFNFDVDPTVRHTVWSCSIGLFFNWLAIYGTNQSQVQRYLSVPSAKVAKRALYWNLLGLWMILSLTLAIGMVIFSKYSNCDPILNKDVQNAEQLFPYFVMQTLGSTPGLPGLFLACLFSAALSTISSGLNSLAAVFLEDILRGNFKIMSRLTPKNEARVSKLLCVIFAVICLAITLLVSVLGNLLQAALALFGVIGGPILGVYCLGIFFPFTNSKGAFSGTCVSLAFLLWIFIGYNVFGIKYPKKPFTIDGCNATNISDQTTMSWLSMQTSRTDPIKQLTGIERFHAISYTWYGLLAVSSTIIVGVVVSLLTKPNKPGEVDPQLLISLTDWIPCFPLRFKKFLHFGYEFKYDKELESNAVHPVDDGLAEKEKDEVVVLDEQPVSTQESKF